MHRTQHPVSGALDDAQGEPREEPQDQHQRAQRHERHDLHRAEVGEVAAQAAEELGQVAGEHALVQPQQVGRPDGHHQHGDGGVDRPGHERALEDEELADETGQAGQADAGQHEEAEGHRVHRRGPGQPAHPGDRAVMAALVDDPHEQEQAARDEPVVDHLQHGALEALLLEDEDAQRHEAHVADRRVGDELLEVGLDQGHDRAIDDGDERQHDDGHREGLRGVREERQREADEAVGAQLEQHAGQDHRAGRRRLHVRVGQPGVEGHHGHLDGEGQEEGQEGARLEHVAEGEAAQLLVVEGTGEGAAMGRREGEGGGQDGHQHEQRADERVEDELDRGVDAVGAAPDADDEVHRHQHDFPEDVEQEEVQGQEDAQHAHFEDEEGDHVLLHPLLDGPEAGQDADPRQERRQHHQQQADAIHAELELDAEGGHPGGRGDEAEPAGVRRRAVETGHQEEREGEAHQRRGQGEAADEHHAVARHDGDEQRAGQRTEDDQGQQRQAVHQRPARSRKPPATMSRPTAMPRA